MLPSVLVLDDDAEVLASLERVLRKKFKVCAFTSPFDALAHFKSSPTHLVISDMRMPDMNGAEFLSQIFEISPRCKRVVLTGYADNDLAKQAINEGHISSYIDKPWDNEALLSKLDVLIQELKIENKKLAVIKRLKLDNERLGNLVGQSKHEHSAQHDLIQQKKQATLNNELLQLSANLVATQTSDLTGHSFRVGQQCKALAKRFQVPDVDVVNIYLAALFYRIGMNSLPQTLLSKPINNMSNAEYLQWAKFPSASADIMKTTDILTSAATIVFHMFEQFDGKGQPERLAEDEIPLCSRILFVVVYYDLLISGAITGKTLSPELAKVKMSSMTAKLFDKKVYSNFMHMLENPTEGESFEVALTTQQLNVGTVLSQDILDTQQHKLLTENTELTAATLNSLTRYQEQVDELLIVYALCR